MRACIFLNVAPAGRGETQPRDAQAIVSRFGRRVGGASGAAAGGYAGTTCSSMRQTRQKRDLPRPATTGGRKREDLTRPQHRLPGKEPPGTAGEAAVPPL